MFETGSGGGAERSGALLAGLRAAGEATRLRLLALLADGELTVKEITEVIGQSQPRVSRHLKLLVDAGLVDRFREGSWAFYRLQESGGNAALGRILVDLVDRDEAEAVRDRARLDIVRQQRDARAMEYFRAHAHEWDRVRALHVDEALVEAAMLAALDGVRTDALLDLGSGTGRVLELFAPRVKRGLGIDVSQDMLTVARSRLDRAGLSHCQVRQGDIYHLSLAADSFDAVIVHQVLHFLEDPARALREAARVLVPGGRLIVVDFAPHSIEFLRDAHAHRRLGFAAEEVAHWLEGAGLDLTERRDLAPDEGETLTVSLWIAQRRAAPALARGEAA